MSLGRVYLITCLANGKQYVGQTRHTVAKRLQQHIYAAVNGRENGRLQNCIRKYGGENFTIEELEACPIETLNKREVYYISEFLTFEDGLNLTTGGGQGTVFSGETSAKRTASQTGHICSAETRAKISAALTGRLMDEATRKKISAGSKGRKLTEEHKKRLAAASKNRIVSDETREKMAKAWFERSEEYRKAFAESARIRGSSDKMLAQLKDLGAAKRKYVNIVNTKTRESHEFESCVACGEFVGAKRQDVASRARSGYLLNGTWKVSYV